MPPINLIVNGTFDAQAAGWSGTDIEANHRESAYLGNGSSNRVAEMDGRSGFVTVMEQSFDVTSSTATELTFDSALRTASNGNAGLEGFTVEILDSSNTVIASLTVLPTANSLTGYSLPVTFPAAGTYTLRLTELGPNDSLGAIVDNIELMVCFHGQTHIRTPLGEKPARDIAVGDLVETENGPKAVRWVGRRKLAMSEIASDPKLYPVKISAGALGRGFPASDLWVSRQHRMLVSSPVCLRMFGQSNVLVSAIWLTALPDIYVDTSVTEVDYVHILFDEHEVVFAEGCPSESLLLGPEAKKSLSSEALDEIYTLFPALKMMSPTAMTTQCIPKRAQQKKLLHRLSKNGRVALENYDHVSSIRPAA